MANWKRIEDIAGFEGITGYRVSDEGDVFSEKSDGEIGTVQDATGGYKVVSISGIKSPLLVHRLVAMAFLSNDEDKPFVLHKDNDKLNNCVGNLQWASKNENEMHALRHGLHDNALSFFEALRMKELLRDTKLSYKKLSDRFGVSTHTVREVSLGRIYSYVGDFEYPIRPFKKRAKRISASVVETVKDRLANGVSLRKINAEFGIAIETIRKIREGRYDD
jgi:DNA-binding Xre family transcriptional regulator